MVASIVIAIIVCIVAVVIYFEYRNEKRYKEERRRQQEKREKKLSPKVTKRAANKTDTKAEKIPVTPKPENLQKPVTPTPSIQVQKPDTKTVFSSKEEKDQVAKQDQIEKKVLPRREKKQQEEFLHKTIKKKHVQTKFSEKRSDRKTVKTRTETTPVAKKTAVKKPTSQFEKQTVEKQYTKEEPTSKEIQTQSKIEKPKKETLKTVTKTKEKKVETKSERPTEDLKQTVEKTPKAEENLSVELPKGEYPDFNYERLLEMGLSEEEAYEFIQDLIPQIGDQIPLLDEALKIPDFHEMERLTHSIKGSSTTIGTGGVSDLLVEYNTYLKTGEEVPIIKAYQEHLKHYFEKLKKQFPAKN